jgi:hypothetical protein
MKKIFTFIFLIIIISGFYFVIQNKPIQEKDHLVQTHVVLKNNQNNLETRKIENKKNILQQAPTFNTNKTFTVEIDFSKTDGAYKDLLGVNKSPLLKTKNGTEIDLSSEYKLFGISEVRMHDDDLDICKIYKDDFAREIGQSGDYSDTCKFVGKNNKHHMI